MEEIKIDITAVDDLLMLPGRRSRPDHIVVIIRGPPGAGKTFVCKLLKVSGTELFRGSIQISFFGCHFMKDT